MVVIIWVVEALLTIRDVITRATFGLDRRWRRNHIILGIQIQNKALDKYCTASIVLSKTLGY